MEPMLPKKIVREIPPSILPEQKKASHKQLRVAAYCRVSTDSDEQEMSFDAQRSYYTDKIMQNPEWTIAGIFADEGKSGTQASKRKDFMRMIRLCRQKKIDMVLTKSVSRFARNTVDCLNYVRELKDLGIPVIFEKEGLNTMHMTSEIYISMHGIFAQSESESLSGNVRLGLQMAARKGKVHFNYKTFLGYRRGPDNLPEIVPEEAETIRLIYQRYLDGDSIVGICRWLESKGRLSPMGKATWSQRTVQSILMNEKYKGDALLQKTYVVDCISHKVKKNDDRPQYYVENSHPAIIPREMFDRVQEELARRASKRKVKQVGTKTETGKYSSKYALTELLICGCCGTPYRRCTWTSHGNKRIVWRCISRLDYGKKYCQDSPSIGEDALHQAIVGAICELSTAGNTKNAIVTLKYHVGLYFDNTDHTAADEIRVKELVAQITAAASSGNYTEEMAAMVDELNTVKERIAVERQQSQARIAHANRLSEVTEAINCLQIRDIQYDDALIRKLVGCIRVLSDKEIEISFKCGTNIRASLKHQE